MAVTLNRRRFTLDEYHRMIEAGIFREDDRVELIEGEIVEMTPIGPPHAATVTRIQTLFTVRLAARAIVWGQNPVLLAAHASEPQPDVVLLAPRADFYASGLPEPSAVHLVIEVGDSSLAYDRRTKAPLYARAGVTEVWIVDVDGKRVEIYRRPSADGYEERWLPGPDERFAPLAFPDVTLSVADLVGP